MTKTWLDMTEEERRAWGAHEYELRQTDLASVKAGELNLESIQKTARQRRRALGPSTGALNYVRKAPEKAE